MAVSALVPILVLRLQTGSPTRKVEQGTESDPTDWIKGGIRGTRSLRNHQGGSLVLGLGSLYFELCSIDLTLD
jgi:hypothetical protein